jgi:hypothetical protein
MIKKSRRRRRTRNHKTLEITNREKEEREESIKISDPEP